ncbi:unnamed protein product [Natator depressus]
MAIDDDNLCSRTKSKLNSYHTDYKSTRRSSLPPDLLLGNDIKGKFQRNIKNLEPIHPRRPKKRPSIFPDGGVSPFSQDSWISALRKAWRAQEVDKTAGV